MEGRFPYRNNRNVCKNDVLKYEDDTYRLIGLPLYNSNDDVAFKREYRKLYLSE